MKLSIIFFSSKSIYSIEILQIRIQLDMSWLVAIG